MNGALAAVCPRCGGGKAGPFATCPACGATPEGRARAMAWLFSREFLSSEELDEVAARVRQGEVPDPGGPLLAYAAAAVGEQPEPSAPDARDLPLGRRDLALLVTANLLLTPLTGFALWFGLRGRRPRAADQAFRFTAPLAAAQILIWVLIVRAWS